MSKIDVLILLSIYGLGWGRVVINLLRKKGAGDNAVGF